MKTMTKLLVLALVLVLALSLTACGKEEPSATTTTGAAGTEAAGETKAPAADTQAPAADTKAAETEAPAVETKAPAAADGEIVGVWKYAIEMRKMLDLSGDAGDMPEEMKGAFDGLSFDMIADLKADGTYALYLDQDSVKTTGEKLTENMRNVIPALIEAEAKEAGITVEDFLAAQNMTMDQVVDQFMTSFDSEEILKGSVEIKENGTYVYEDGKINFQPESGDAQVWTVTVNGNEMTLTEVEDSNEQIAALLPMTWTK